MSRGRRLALLVIALALLALAALLLTSTGDGPGGRRTIAAEGSPGADSPDAARLLGGLSERADARRREQLRREDPRGEPGPTAATLRRWRRVERVVEPTARRFHSALSRYELGQPAARVLRRTATPRLASSLLRRPPRPPRGAPPERARLGRLELLPAESEGGRLARVELVGRVIHGGRPDPIAIELRRTTAGWRVAGIGL
ncbi:MAG: hypothetical protein EDQ89_02535 [Acidobacteria bacterium]|nr:MAG: hypothetical protein EDQ89_02535 [Acidobacteriota bacterium]GIK77724.1 MAG: hypothetical protein BroJett022_14140 [Actinomycetes bacterium]